MHIGRRVRFTCVRGAMSACARAWKLLAVLMCKTLASAIFSAVGYSRVVQSTDGS